MPNTLGQVWCKCETLPQFVEASVRASVERRCMQAEFIAPNSSHPILSHWDNLRCERLRG
jgi:hypothetical protein